MTNRSMLTRALLCQEVDYTPVWIMRQAGRYLPEYRAIREKAKDFLTLCKTPELATTVTLQPIQRFPLDAAIIFSDILILPDALGLGLHFLEGEGPVLTKKIRSYEDVASLPTIDPESECRYVMEAIRLVKKELPSSLPLIGFAGSPFTVATYMVEGGTSKHFNAIKKMLYQDPAVLHQLLLNLSKLTTAYLNAQIQAGADVVMLFDTWGGILNGRDYLSFSLNYMKMIIVGLRSFKHREVPIILFTKNGGQHLTEIAKSGCNAIGLDWTADLRVARQTVGHSIALQGNLDPAVLYASPQIIEREVKTVLEQFGNGFGHVFNLGHGIHPDVPPENVHAMIEAVHSLSRRKIKETSL